MQSPAVKKFVSIGRLASRLGVDDIMLGMSVCQNPKLEVVLPNRNAQRTNISKSVLPEERIIAYL